MHFKFDFSAEWPLSPQCLALCLNIIIHSFLCPVRSLRVALERTKSAVSRASCLFVSPHSPSRHISKNAVSFFLREVISGVGAVRGFLQIWSVSKALEALSWRSNSVFASFYLCDVQYVMEGLRSLGPIVAAGSVLP